MPCKGITPGKVSAGSAYGIPIDNVQHQGHDGERVHYSKTARYCLGLWSCSGGSLQLEFPSLWEKGQGVRGLRAVARIQDCTTLHADRCMRGESSPDLIGLRNTLARCRAEIPHPLPPLPQEERGESSSPNSGPIHASPSATRGLRRSQRNCEAIVAGRRRQRLWSSPTR